MERTGEMEGDRKEGGSEQSEKPLRGNKNNVRGVELLK